MEIQRIDIRETPKIDVKRTLQKILNEAQKIYAEYISSILIAMEQEQKEIPIKYPPKEADGLDVLIWIAKEGTLFSFVEPKDNTPEKLIPFVKLQKEMQQKVLFRAFYVYLRMYAATQRMRNFPLVFIDKGD